MGEFSGIDVLKRAVKIIKTDSLKDEKPCSPYCPWCAMAEAKGLLDDENEIDVPLGEYIRQVVMNDFHELEIDAPLVEARKSLGAFNDIDNFSITKTKAIRILQEGIKNLHKGE